MKAFRLAMAAVTGLLVGYFIGQADMNRTIRAHDRAIQTQMEAAARSQNRSGCEGIRPQASYHFHPGVAFE